MQLSHPRCLKGKPKLNYEVCFNEFVPIHPWGDMPPECEPLKLNVSKLCHVTHKEEAHIIRQTNCFKPKRKLGKSDDGCNPGRSYRNKHVPIGPSESDEMECDDQPTGGVEEANEYMYEHITTNDKVFHGFYSWWGLYVEKPISGLQVYDLPNYLRDPPDSIYGSTAFTIPFDKILESYASSRSCHLHDLRLMIGGTMRYKREIAYVIIVCTRTDDLSYGLITSLNAPDLLDVEGFIDGEGRIEDIRHFPSFTTRYYDASESHEALNFAFYFPEKQDFTCQVDKIDVKEDIKHTGCIRRVEMHYYYDPDTGFKSRKPLCPDDITDKHRKEHDQALYWYEYYQNSM